MPLQTTLTHNVGPRDRIIPVESTAGFGQDDAFEVHGERMRIFRIASDHSFVVNRAPKQPITHRAGSVVTREE